MRFRRLSSNDYPRKLGPKIYKVLDSVTPEVEVVEYSALPRTDRKSKRVFDTRITDSVV
jgi:phenylacetate-coenzyme A ligase PaaK-like adenylate-forming protein